MPHKRVPKLHSNTVLFRNNWNARRSDLFTVHLISSYRVGLIVFAFVVVVFYCLRVLEMTWFNYIKKTHIYTEYNSIKNKNKNIHKNITTKLINSRRKKSKFCSNHSRTHTVIWHRQSTVRQSSYTQLMHNAITFIWHSWIVNKWFLWPGFSIKIEYSNIIMI